MKTLQYYELTANEIIKKNDLQFILNRLGYKKTKTIVSEEEIKKLSDLIEEAKAIAKPIGVVGIYQNHETVRRVDIETKASYMKVTGDYYEDKSVFIDSQLSQLLNVTANSAPKVKNIMAGEYLYVSCVTLGSVIDQQIRQLMEQGELYKTAVLDAAASVFVDNGISYLLKKTSEKLIGEGLEASSLRISPGQLEIPLKAQKMIYSLLRLEELNIDINDHFMLTPQKTVIAIASFHKVHNT